MENNFFTRLDQFMQYKNLNDNKITVQTKLAVGTLGKQRRNGKGMSYESIVKILKTYPELNPTWLILGDGEMLLKDQKKNISLESISEILSTQKKLITRQQEKLDLLISLLDYIREEISEGREDIKKLGEQPCDNA